MRRLFALILVICLWVGFTPTSASAGTTSVGLVPCSESPAFQQRAEGARPTTDDPASGQKRFERYSQALCGPEGLPHLIVDGRLGRAGDFVIPSILFLFMTGWIGWVGRAYLQAIKKEGKPNEKEVNIDVPLALRIMLTGFTWPLAALKELTTGELFAKDDEITVSPR